MIDVLTQFGAAESGNILDALGIDWKMLVFQLIGFLILVVLMAKFVYPPLMRTIDARQEKIEAGNKAAEAAEKQAEVTKAEVEKLMKKARDEARDIVATAKEEAASAVEAAEDKAKARAEHIVSDAHEQLGKDIAAARRALHNDTIELVAMATERVIGKTVDAKVDQAVVTKSLEEAK